MKKLILICCVVILLIPMVFGGLLPEPSPPYDPGDVKFLYDSNKVFYKSKK